MKIHLPVSIAHGRCALPASPQPQLRTGAKVGRAAVLAMACATVLCATGTGASAQECSEMIGEASAPTREAALSQAFEGVLQAKDQRSWQAWRSGSRKVGDAPGYVVRKLSSQCTPSRAGQSCRVAVLLCRR